MFVESDEREAPALFYYKHVYHKTVKLRWKFVIAPRWKVTETFPDPRYSSMCSHPFPRLFRETSDM